MCSSMVERVCCWQPVCRFDSCRIHQTTLIKSINKFIKCLLDKIRKVWYNNKGERDKGSPLKINQSSAVDIKTEKVGIL